MDERRLKKFIDVANSAGGLVILITQPDPDSLGGAMGLAAILEHVTGRPVRICYSGAFGHPQNRSVANMFDLHNRMVPIQSCKIGPAERLVLVDSSDLHDARVPKEMLPLNPCIVIDHHRGELPHEGDDHFFWVEDMGSASTLIVELACATKTPIDNKLALILALGIYTDSQALVSANSRDRDAYGVVTAQIEPHSMAQLIKYSLPNSYFKTLNYALSNMDQRGGKLLVSAGFLKPENSDDVSTIADYLLRKEGVSLVIVWGLVGYTLRISARSTDITIPLAQFLQNRFGKHAAGAKLTPDGHSEGGGSITFELGLFAEVAGAKKELEAWVNACMKELVFQ